MKSVAVTGYFATGSGAVINLLQEYTSINDAGISDYEHIFLYDVNGIFETINKILYSNNLFQSNAAINELRKSMKRLNNIDFGWFGGYKYKYGNQFLKMIEEFINEITEYEIHKDWYGTYLKRKITLERIVKDFFLVILKRKKFDHNFGSKIIMDKSNTFQFSFADETKLQSATKKLVKQYIDLIYQDDDKIALINHMLLPQNIDKLNDYLPDDFKLIIVDRDVRDLYVYNKYTNLWGGSIFPKEINSFIEFTKKYRNTEPNVTSEKILRIQFEDLIYHYDFTVKRIEDFLGIDSKEHIYMNKYFDPNKSIKNTQLFNIKDDYKEEIDKLIQELPELIYAFPYHYNADLKDIFDA